MGVTVHFAPHRAAPLATYMAIVARLAREVPGECWLRYDRMFRQAAAVNPALPWDRREPDVWLAAMVERSAPTGGGSTVTPQAQPIQALCPSPWSEGLLAPSIRLVLWHMQICTCLCPVLLSQSCGEGLPQAARPLVGGPRTQGLGPVWYGLYS